MRRKNTQKVVPMSKKAFFCAISLLLACPAAAQDSARIPDDFDPLEERFKIEAAFIPNYRDMMRDVVSALGQYARDNNPDFLVFADGGLDLLTRGEWENNLDDLHRAEKSGAKTDDEKFLLKLFSPEHPIPEGTPIRRYIQALNGVVLKNRVCSGKTGVPTPAVRQIIDEYGLTVIGVEHCPTAKQRAAAKNSALLKKSPVHVDSDAADAFDAVSAPENETADNVVSPAKAKNMLVLTNTRRFSDKDLLIKTLADTNFDLLVVDPFFKSNIALTKDDVKELQTKKIGSKRLVFAVLNVAVAEDTRPYWEKGWKPRDPAWLRFASKDDPDKIVVDYWNPDWKRIVGIYFRGIMELGFDGVVLQGLDHHKTYERIIPID